jgi:xylulokinase
VFFGVTLGHERNEILRSVLEGAAYAIRHVVEILEEERELDIPELRIGGAAAVSSVWNQIIADVLGKNVISLTQAHTEVLGAAVLAGVGIGAYPDYGTALKQVVAFDREYEPDPDAHAAYDSLFPIYKELYLDVEGYFERLARLDLPQVWVTKRGER